MLNYGLRNIIKVLKKLIEIFTDEDDVVIDPVAGSGTTLRASYELGRNAYGFEIEKKFYNDAKDKMLVNMSKDILLKYDELSSEEEKYESINLFDE